MSLSNNDRGQPVHIPADPRKFQFDSEVSRIFPDMAVRSIPNFLEAHATHAAMLKPWLQAQQCSILDIGASRGHFYHALKKAHPDLMRDPKVSYTAVDVSPDMCAHLKTDIPDISVRCQDITAPEFLTSTTKYDVVCLHYVLQFIQPHLQSTVLERVVKMVRPGGVFIYGHKGRTEGGEVGTIAHEEYIKFRMANGYTREEIEKKTAALKNSMWPVNDRHIRSIFDTMFEGVQETYRFMMFNTYFCIK